MRALSTTLLLIGTVCHLFAQEGDTTVRLAAKFFRQADSADRHNPIWEQPLYGPILLVDPQTRITYANRPDSAGVLTPMTEGIYRGHLPADVMVANTAINWSGQRWTVVLWPLPADKEERLNLLLHECFHRIQDKLGLPAHSPTIEHLATLKGRIYFLLELQALKEALEMPVDQRKTTLAHALLFRKKRQELFPSTFDDERKLEMNEGLAEYTGMILGRSAANIRQHLYKEIDKAASLTSLIRSMAYITGPVYGYLLYEQSPAWIRKVDSNASFSMLVCDYYKIVVPERATSSELAKLKKRYNGDKIIRDEKRKEKDRQQQVGLYTRLFTQKPVLIINLVKMNIVFNPNNLFDLGGLGTVYPTAAIKDVWGNLTVTSGGMLMKNWQVVTLPAMKSLNIKDNIIQGNGWYLELDKRWRLEKKDRLHFILVSGD